MTKAEELWQPFDLVQKKLLCLLKKPFSVSRTGCSLCWLISTEYSLTMGFCFISVWHWRDFCEVYSTAKCDDPNIGKVKGLYGGGQYFVIALSFFYLLVPIILNLTPKGTRPH